MDFKCLLLFEEGKLEKIEILTAKNGYFIKKGENSWICMTTHELLMLLVKELPNIFIGELDDTITLALDKKGD